jgi:hypothetical protein
VIGIVAADVPGGIGKPVPYIFRSPVSGGTRIGSGCARRSDDTEASNMRLGASVDQTEARKRS